MASLEADKLKPSQVEGLEVRLAALRDGVVDIHTAEGAVGRAQVNTCLKCSLPHTEDTSTVGAFAEPLTFFTLKDVQMLYGEY